MVGRKQKTVAERQKDAREAERPKRLRYPIEKDAIGGKGKYSPKHYMPEYLTDRNKVKHQNEFSFLVNAFFTVSRHTVIRLTHHTSTCKSKCEMIKEHVYDVVPGKNVFDVFAKATMEIRAYIASNVFTGGEFRLVMRPDNLGFPAVNPPADPINPTDVMQMKRWEAASKKYEKII
jgi:hypothetical protein